MDMSILPLSLLSSSNADLFPLSFPLRRHLPRLPQPRVPTVVTCNALNTGAFQSSVHPAGKNGGRSNISTMVAFDPKGSVDFPMYDEAEIPQVGPALPPTEGRFDIVINNDVIKRLDLSPAHAVLGNYVKETGDDTCPVNDPKHLLERTVGFVINYERDDPHDPRELSELPDIRLWFVRLDAAYPWMPVVLDWRAGELARYAAMLVPHQMSSRLGVVYNPEALELFAMKKLFITYAWLKHHKIANPVVKTRDMMRMIGFGIADDLYKLIEANSPMP
eukprot:Gb_20870 [translate_table: standard]